MATHFNAFISYRHSPLDSAVAQRIHRQLERFKIPKAIQKTTGIQKIDRIFRDKEELPLSVNLSDDINEALINSDFLIVICSPRFQQSQWCMREIELFLQTHPIERVLIVLAEGEPDDVVPPILTQNREPLCCDYRMKPKKAKLIELPRLVSAILGCRYDDLRQRQRQYRMRRMVALFSAALAASLALSAYFINTSIQIQKANDDLTDANEQIQMANQQIQANLEQALKNQSQYLTSASQERLEAGDRLMAISLALAALPVDSDRPYVAEAELALNQAISAYQPESGISAKGSIKADALVEDFVVTADGKLLYVLDARKIVTIWDTITFQKLGSIDLTGIPVREMRPTVQGNVLFVTGNMEQPLLCYGKDGQKLWQRDEIKDIACLGEQTLLALQNNYTKGKQIHFLDMDTGEELRPPMDLHAEEEDRLFLRFSAEDFPAGASIAVECSVNNTTHIYLADPETDSLTFLLEVDTSFSGAGCTIETVGVDSRGNVIVMRGDGSGMYNGNYVSSEITSPDRDDLLCYDPQTGKLLWQSEIITFVYSTVNTVRQIPGAEKLLVQNGNTFQIHDSNTGEVLSRYQTTVEPLTVQVDGDKTWGILADGCAYDLLYDNGLGYATPFTSEAVDIAAVQKGYFVHMPLETSVKIYRSGENDESIPFDYTKAIYPRKEMQQGDCLALSNLNELFLIDTQQRKLLWSKELDYGHELIGFLGENVLIWYKNDETLKLFACRDGKEKWNPMPIALEEGEGSLTSNLFLHEEKLFFFIDREGAVYLRQADGATGKTEQTIRVPELDNEVATHSANTAILAVAGKYMWLQKNGTDLYVLDRYQGVLQPILRDMTGHAFVQLAEDEEEVLIAAEHRLLLADPRGSVLMDADLGDLRGVSACFYGDELLVLCDDGQLYRYDRAGKRLSQTALQIFNTFSSNASKPLESPLDVFWRFTPEGDLILNAFGAGNVICCDSWQVKAYVPSLFAYAEESNEFLTTKNGILQAYRCHTLEEQVKKAKEILGSFTLTEEQKKYYGLSGTD